MTIWLCPVKPKSWRVIRKRRTFGAPIGASKVMRLVRPGDLLIFHVLGHAHSIVAVYKATSEVFEDHEDIWGRGRYPLRMGIELFQDITADHGNPVPLSCLFSNNSNQEIQIEPYLRNIWITEIPMKQYRKLQEFISAH